MDDANVLTGHDAALPDADAAMIDQNIDDLFGEAADGLAVDALGVALPPAPLPPSVVLRIMEKQSRGCCT
jgi:mediator of RNA polymerase II transcription subunit 16, fungi type